MLRALSERAASCSHRCERTLPAPRVLQRAAWLRAYRESGREASTQPGEGVEQGWLWQSLAAGRTREKLQQHGIKARKALGQNFLTDDQVLQRIVRESGVQAGDAVIEVGPGTGNLTRHLLAAGARVTAIEKDRRLFEELSAGGVDASQLSLVCDDVLRVDLRALARQMSAASGGENVRVVANLPYNITTDFLKKSLPLGDAVTDLFVMVQDEVAQRLTNLVPGGAEYRAMNIRCSLLSTPEYLFWIPRTAFYPSPNVDSALVRFRLKRSDQLPDLGRTPAQFLALVNLAFSSRRKMLKNNLRAAYRAEVVDGAIAQAGLEADVRPQELSVEDFVRLSRALASGAGAEGGVGQEDADGSDGTNGEEDE